MATSKKLTGKQLSDLTSSAADTPASRSAKPAKGKAKTTRATSGHGYEKPLALYDPNTQSWKTYEATSASGSKPYLGKWPPSGMTLDGIAYQLPPSAPRTSATAYSLSLGHQGPNSQGLWPTATTQDHGTRYAQGGMPLGMAVRLWPTPTTQEVEHPNAKWNQNNRRIAANGNTHSMNLADAVKLTNPGATGKLNPTWVEWLMGFPIGWTDCED